MDASLNLGEGGISRMTGRRPSSKQLVLTSRLVSRSGFAEALAELQKACLRYTAIIHRSIFSTEVAETDAITIVFHEDEPLVEDGVIDPRLTRSKQVTLLMTVKDGGTATVNLTSRVISPLYTSKELVRVIGSFNGKLVEASKSRWTTVGSMIVLACLPFLALGAVIFGDAALDPRVGRVFFNSNPKAVVPWDSWVGPSLVLILLCWIPILAVAAVMFFIRLSSGPLRIWPERMTRKYFVLGASRIRGSDTSHKYLGTLAVGIVTGIVVAVFTHLI